jgi:hypothetical protein
VCKEDCSDPILLIEAHPAPEALIIKLISKGMNAALALDEFSFALGNTIVDILLRCIGV